MIKGTTTDPVAVARERFRNDTKTHELTIIHDDGVYRHLRCMAPKTYIYGFDVVTWPGHLAITGDMGECMWQRVHDMFEFFPANSELNVQLSYDYWAEKVRPGGRRSVQEFSADVYRQVIVEWMERQLEELKAESGAETSESLSLRDAVGGLLLRFDPSSEYEAHERMSKFEHDGRQINEFYEYSLLEYESRYLWQCWAVTWAIGMYQLQKDPVTA